jgi:hypothetical protein
MSVWLARDSVLDCFQVVRGVLCWFRELVFQTYVLLNDPQVIDARTASDAQQEGFGCDFQLGQDTDRS